MCACLEVDVVEDLAHARVQRIDAELRYAQELLRGDEALQECASACVIDMRMIRSGGL
jgi:hypothetical protein